MLIDKNEQRWSVFTPCKAGCMSLEATLRDRAGIAYQIYGRHRLPTMPVRTPVRIMIVREPVARWESMYWFIHKHIGKSCYMQDFAATIDEFVNEWEKRCELKEDHWWFHSQTHIMNVYSPTHIFKLEEDGIEQICAMLRSMYGYDIPKASHTNKNHHKQSAVLPTERILQHWGVDRYTFGY